MSGRNIKAICNIGNIGSPREIEHWGWRHTKLLVKLYDSLAHFLSALLFYDVFALIWGIFKIEYKQVNDFILGIYIVVYLNQVSQIQRYRGSSTNLIAETKTLLKSYQLSRQIFRCIFSFHTEYSVCKSTVCQANGFSSL